MSGIDNSYKIDGDVLLVIHASIPPGVHRPTTDRPSVPVRSTLLVLLLLQPETEEEGALNDVGAANLHSGIFSSLNIYSLSSIFQKFKPRGCYFSNRIFSLIHVGGS